MNIYQMIILRTSWN